MATRSSISTTSSMGRRPLGNPDVSPPRTPRSLCDATGVTAVLVLRRSISEAVTVGGWLSPLHSCQECGERGRCVDRRSAP